MIPKQIKAHYQTGLPVVREYAALMTASFKYYGETHALFFEKLPGHLHQSELVSFINNDIKNRLFDKSFCEGIQESLKSLRRVTIRLEDLRGGQPQIPSFIHNLERLISLAERVEALYQLHWEYFRYQSHLNEEELVGFLLEIDNIGKDWDNFQAGQSNLRKMLESLSGALCPEGRAAVTVSYQCGAPSHFSVATLRSLMNFFDGCYSFVCAVSAIDPGEEPLMLLQLEVAEPMELYLAVPVETEAPFRKMLQHLFLKNLLKKETLLKFVFEDVQMEYGKGKALAAATLTGFQKKLSENLKQLPAEGRFTVSGRTFPDDGIQVLQEFTSSLEDKKINYSALLKAAEKGMSGRKSSPPPAAKTIPSGNVAAKAPPSVVAESKPRLERRPSIPPPTPPAQGRERELEREHIRILTDSG